MFGIGYERNFFKINKRRYFYSLDQEFIYKLSKCVKNIFAKY